MSNDAASSCPRPPALSVVSPRPPFVFISLPPAQSTRSLTVDPRTVKSVSLTLSVVLVYPTRQEALLSHQLHTPPTPIRHRSFVIFFSFCYSGSQCCTGTIGVSSLWFIRVMFVFYSCSIRAISVCGLLPPPHTGNPAPPSNLCCVHSIPRRFRPLSCLCEDLYVV